MCQDELSFCCAAGRQRCEGLSALHQRSLRQDGLDSPLWVDEDGPLA